MNKYRKIISLKPDNSYDTANERDYKYAKKSDLSDYNTKSEANTKYALKPLNLRILEEWHYENGSNTSYYQFDRIYGEYFVIRGYFTNDLSFEINQIISENTMINVKKDI